MSERLLGALNLVTAPAVEPVTLADALMHLRIDNSPPADESLILGMVEAAKDQIENLTGRRLITQTWKWTLDDFPTEGRMDLPLSPASSVVSIKYTDINGVQYTFASSNYIVDIAPDVARVVLKTGIVWPSTSAGLKESGAVEVSFVVGYGTSAASVPERLKLAIKELASDFYNNREDTTPLTMHKVSNGVMRLIQPYRVEERTV